MNVFEVLKQDHQTVRNLFSQIEKAGGKQDRDQLFRKLKQELIAHAHAEEKAFYPKLENNKETGSQVKEGIEEHHQVENMLQRVSSMDAGGQDWLDKVRELKQMVEHHVQEEENEIFPKAQGILPENQIDQLAGQIEQAKKDELS